MASFDIVEMPPAVIAVPARERQGEAVAIELAFTVANLIDNPVVGRLRVQPQDDTRAEWLAIKGETERVFAPGEHQRVSLQLAIPPGTQAGRYRFRLRVVNVNDPDNDFADSTPCTIDVPAEGSPPPPPPLPQPAPTERFSLTRVFRRSLVQLRSRPIFVVLCAVFLVGLPVFLFVQNIELELGLLPLLLLLLGNGMLQLAIAKMMRLRLSKQSPGIPDRRGGGFRRIASLLVISPIIFFSTIFGAFFGANPLGLALIVTEIENLGPIAAIRRSAELMRSSPASAPISYLGLMALGFVALILFRQSGRFVFAQSGLFVFAYYDSFALGIGVSMYALLGAAFAASLYVELRIVKDGASEDQLELSPPQPK